MTTSRSTERGSASRITLSENMTVETIAKMHGRFVKCAAKELDVNIYAQKVAQIDYSALQLLCSLVKQVRGNGNVIIWRKPSEVLLHSASITGLTTTLGLGGQDNDAHISEV